MTIDFTKNGGHLKVLLNGRLDTVTAPEFEGFYEANAEGINELTVDCKNLEYVSSAGLRVFLSLQKKLKNSMKLINVCELVMEVFEMTGFADILNIE